MKVRRFGEKTTATETTAKHPKGTMRRRKLVSLETKGSGVVKVAEFTCFPVGNSFGGLGGDGTPLLNQDRSPVHNTRESCIAEEEAKDLNLTLRPPLHHYKLQ
ncbi:hypothetical protein RUM44_007022 [Polyplax serrata]|uniref:Uncharacterized protein n=1 Tax=Polyplax serrata TaxID=468196 RepID=A0ABR1AZI8_POLSC